MGNAMSKCTPIGSASAVVPVQIMKGKWEWCRKLVEKTVSVIADSCNSLKLQYVEDYVQLAYQSSLKLDLQTYRKHHLDFIIESTRSHALWFAPKSCGPDLPSLMQGNLDWANLIAWVFVFFVIKTLSRLWLCGRATWQHSLQIKMLEKKVSRK